MTVTEMLPAKSEFRWVSDGGLKTWTPREVDVFIASRHALDNDALDKILEERWSELEEIQRSSGFDGLVFRTRRENWTVARGPSPRSGQDCNIFFNSISLILIPRNEVVLEVLEVTKSKKFDVQVQS